MYLLKYSEILDQIVFQILDIILNVLIYIFVFIYLYLFRICIDGDSHIHTRTGHVNMQ